VALSQNYAACQPFFVIDPMGPTPAVIGYGDDDVLVVPFPSSQAGVAQLDRASVYETEGYRFESCHPRSIS
jgi:hypothetical protein